ncbi:MAG: MFS transporter, partial [Ignavibacteria bacterium]
MSKKPESRNPWWWVPSLYYAEGIPYVMVMTVSVAFYKRMNVSNSDIALFTSLLYFPWVLKPLWSPAVDIIKTKRLWIILMQLLVSIGLA